MKYYNLSEENQEELANAFSDYMYFGYNASEIKRRIRELAEKIAS